MRLRGLSARNAPDGAGLAPSADQQATTVADTAARGLGGIVAGVLPATLILQALSLVSSVVMAHVLGASESTDAYFLALSVPVVTYAILLAASRLGAIPLLTSVKKDEPERLSAACSEIVSVTLAAAAGLAIIATLFAVVAIPLASGGSGHLASTTRQLILELAPYAVTGALAGVLGAILAVEGRFASAVIVLGFEPVLKIVLVVTAGTQLGVQSLVIGNLVGSSLTVLALWRLVVRRGIALRIVPRRTPAMSSLVKVSAPLLVGQSLLQVNPLVDRMMASGISPGSVTVLDLALRLVTVPAALLGSVAIGPLTATWSARFAESGWPGLRESFARTMVVAVTILPPLAATGFVLREPVVSAIYAGGAYSDQAVHSTASALGMFMLGLPAQLTIIAVAMLFVVRSDVMLPVKIAIANLVINVALNAAFRGPLGVAGIALSTAVTLTVLCVVYVVAARRRWGSLGLRAARRPLALSLLTAVVVGVFGTVLVNGVDATTRWQQIVLVLALATAAAGLHITALTLGGEMNSDKLRSVRFGLRGRG